MSAARAQLYRGDGRDAVAAHVVRPAPYSVAAATAIDKLIDAGKGVQSSPWTVWTMRSLFAAALLLVLVLLLLLLLPKLLLL